MLQMKKYMSVDIWFWKLVIKLIETNVISDIEISRFVFAIWFCQSLDSCEMCILNVQ